MHVSGLYRVYINILKAFKWNMNEWWGIIFFVLAHKSGCFLHVLGVSKVPELRGKLREACRKKLSQALPKSALATTSYHKKTDDQKII